MPLHYRLRRRIKPQFPHPPTHPELPPAKISEQTNLTGFIHLVNCGDTLLPESCKPLRQQARGPQMTWLPLYKAVHTWQQEFGTIMKTITFLCGNKERGQWNLLRNLGNTGKLTWINQYKTLLSSADGTHTFHLDLHISFFAGFCHALC